MLLFEFTIEEEKDIVTVRQGVREVARVLEFGLVDQTRIITAASELSRNIFHYAEKGKVLIQEITEGASHGIQLVFEDQGPGIENLELVLQGGYSKGNSLGLGLSGCKRLMDEFDISTTIGKGTKVVIKKWL